VLIDNYGFDPKHGIETYNISQIKLLVEKNGPTEEFLKDLKKCVDLLKDFYRWILARGLTVEDGWEELSSLRQIPHEKSVRDAETQVQPL